MEDQNQQEAPSSDDDNTDELATLRAQLDAVTVERDQARDDIAQVRTEHAATISAYKQAVTAGLPAQLADFVTGDTITDIDAAAAKVREAQKAIAPPSSNGTQAHTPPPPQRPPSPDLDAMTPFQKLRHGLEQRAAASR